MGLEIFLHGFWFGSISCGVFLVTLRQIKKNRGNMGARNRPLDTFHDAGQQKQTAKQIYRQSRRARILFLLWIVIFVIEVLVFAYMFEQRWFYFSNLS